METIDITLISDTLLDLCSMKASHISFLSDGEKLYIAVFDTEYFKVSKITAPAKGEVFAVRIPKRICKLFAHAQTISFEISGEDVKIDWGKCRVKIPLEIDYNDVFLQELLSEAIMAPETQYNLECFKSLRSAISLTEVGIHVVDSVAYICEDGYQIYKKVALPFQFVASSECIQALLSLIKSSGSQCKVYKYNSYAVFENQGYYFGWLGMRQVVQSDYNYYMQCKPILEITADISGVIPILANMTINKNDIHKCILNLHTDSFYIEISSTVSCNIQYRVKALQAFESGVLTELTNSVPPIETCMNNLTEKESTSEFDTNVDYEEDFFEIDDEDNDVEDDELPFDCDSEPVQIDTSRILISPIHLPLQALMKIFTFNTMNYYSVTIRVFDSFVAFVADGTHILFAADISKLK